MTLESQRPNNLYNSTQQELYQVCRLGHNSLVENLAAFTAFKPKYDAAFAVQFLADVKAAEKLPSFQRRDDITETAHEELTLKGDEGLVKWQALKRYIEDAYEDHLIKTKLEAAGQLSYTQASHGNWEVLKGMLIDASEFINDNITDLTANDNMPPAFQGQFDTVKDEFEGLLTDFGDAEGDTKELTDEKINANNAIFETLMTFFLDGQEIFRKEPAKRDRFVFVRVLELVRGAKGKNKEFTVPANDKITVERVVANSSIINNGEVTLWIDKGQVESQSPPAIQLDPGAEITRPEKGETLTIFNNDLTTEGRIQLRVTVD